MSCLHIEEYLRRHPEDDLTEEAAAHLRGCADCRTRYREITGLDALLAALTPSQLPPYFEARLRAAQRREDRPARALRPMLAPLAAAAAGLTLVLFWPARPDGDRGLAERRGSAPPPLPAAVPGLAAAGRLIMPVWPGDGDAVCRSDLTITAAMSPPASAAALTVAVDNIDLTAASDIGDEYVAVSPRGLPAGRHTVTVSLAQPDGTTRSASWSFYLLEDAS